MDDLLTSVSGTFYRTIDPAYRYSVIAGSRLAGRYSRLNQPTLYLGSSVEGMAASIAVHKNNRATAQEIIEIDVTADRIFDLRNAEACDAAGIKVSDAMSAWQDLVASGESPPSWSVRDRVVALGGKGLIDLSRQLPNQWHLVLFDWNQGTEPNVKVLGTHRL